MAEATMGKNEYRMAAQGCWYNCGSVAYDLSTHAAACARRHPLQLVDGGARRTPRIPAGTTALPLDRYRSRADEASLFSSSRFTAAIKVLLCLVLVGMTALAVAVPNLSRAALIASVPTEYVSVAQGDSLWALSESHPIDGLSTQECVKWIIDQNGLSSSILMPGQVIKVPQA